MNLSLPPVQQTAVHPGCGLVHLRPPVIVPASLKLQQFLAVFFKIKSLRLLEVAHASEAKLEMEES